MNNKREEKNNTIDSIKLGDTDKDVEKDTDEDEGAADSGVGEQIVGRRKWTTSCQIVI